MTQKIALVTGANRGLGLEISKQLGALGITVLMGARTLSSAEEAAKQLSAKGFDAVGVQLEVTSKEDIAALAEWIERRYGKLDILINNAGIAVRSSGGNLEAFRQTFEVNTFAPFLLTESLLPLLLKSKAGRIVNQSSAIGSITLMHTDETVRRLGDPAYAASKAALNMLTAYWAQKLESTPLKVNSTHPGLVQTDMGGANAEIPVEEGAKTAVALAVVDADGPSGEFFYMGQTLPW
ncbi:SDR family oxidoreductase [Paenibacillus sp. URB8-2]|uniref:SDR family oxidoreductase n=1 Tax=Paenibacillus sp. URB8-2 TaxID=2741301 RepID=UPI0015B9C5EA|nr:SDR family oxidoreductase [Paenibacillus sp. URB8-2]BCG59377.1 short-chain dehydrogenase [Paenibacillus sp. URB8-2]